MRTREPMTYERLVAVAAAVAVAVPGEVQRR